MIGAAAVLERILPALAATPIFGLASRFRLDNWPVGTTVGALRTVALQTNQYGACGRLRLVDLTSVQID